MRQTEGELTDTLMEFAARRYGPDSLEVAWGEYTFWRGAPLDPETEPELDSSFGPWFLFNWEPDNAGRQEGERCPDVPVARLYLEEHPEKLEPFARRFIEEACAQPYSFFMVTGAEPGRRLFLKDLLVERELGVVERTSSKTLRKGQIIYTRVVTLDDVSIMLGCAPVAIPIEFFNHLIDFRETLSARLAEELAGGELAKRGFTSERVESLMPDIMREVVQDQDLKLREMYYMFRESLLSHRFPQVSNTDGEEMRPVNLHYSLGCPPREAFDALKSLALGESDADLLMGAEFDGRGELAAVRFPWLRKGNRTHESWDNTILGMLDIKGEKLLVEVNSRERADAIGRKITRRLGWRAVLQNTVYESVEAVLAETAAGRQGGQDSAGRAPLTSAINSARDESDDLMALPEVQEKVREMTARHWATWPDVPLPALEGQTPREAAATPLGRERLEALLLDFEGLADSASQAGSRPPDSFAPDIAALRRELGLGD